MDHQLSVIGLHGLPGVGKDTAADLLVREFGFVRRGFADPLYEEVAEAFDVKIEWLRDRNNKERPSTALAAGFCKDQDFVALLLKREPWNFTGSHSPREILRLWGTEYRRSQRDDYWIRQMDDFRVLATVGSKGLVVPDVRFENEAAWLRIVGGRLVEIRRPGCEGSEHASDLPIAQVDYTIINDRAIKDLEEHMEAIYYDICARGDW